MTSQEIRAITTDPRTYNILGNTKWDDKRHRTPRYDGYKNHRRGETYNIKWHCKNCRSIPQSMYGCGFYEIISVYKYGYNSPKGSCSCCLQNAWDLIDNPEFPFDGYSTAYMFPFDTLIGRGR